MSRMSELSQVLDEMIACGEGMIRAAQEIKAIFSETHEETPAEPVKPVSSVEQADNAVQAETEQPKEYTFTDVRKAFADKSHAGFTAQVKELIGKYGASRLSDIKEADYAALMADLEVIG